MTHLGYLLAGWGIALAAFAIYAWTLVKRGRELAARVPVERQRWMHTDGDRSPGTAT